MENAPVIMMSFGSPTPGTDVELYERFEQWVIEVYIPMRMKFVERMGTDFCQIIQESFEYPRNGTVSHYKNLDSWENSQKTQERNAVMEEIRSWQNRGVMEQIWSPVYELERSFRGDQKLEGDRVDTRIADAPIMHLEGYRLSSIEQKKYENWLAEHGYNVFIPLFVKLPGIRGYDTYKITGSRFVEAREIEYPSHLSIVYFENLKAYEDYARSRELMVFQKALRSVFPLGPNVKWHVQYQLVKSWRK